MFTVDEIVSVVKDFGLPDHIRALFWDYLTPAGIRVVIGTSDGQPHASQWGGDPMLPNPDWWPKPSEKPLHFICQINLQDLQPLVPPAFVPKTGVLSFFISEWQTKTICAPIYFNTDRVSVVSPPENLTDSRRVSQSESAPLSFVREWDFPDPSRLLPVLPRSDWGLYCDFFKELHTDPPSITSCSRLFCPRIEGYGQKEMTEHFLRSSVEHHGVSAVPLYRCGLLAYFDIASLGRRACVFNRISDSGQFDAANSWVEDGEA